MNVQAYGLFSQVRWYLNCPPFLSVWITYLQMPSLGSLLEKAAKRFSAASFHELVFSRAWAISSSELLGKVSFKASIALASIVTCNQHNHLRSIVTLNPGCMLDHFTKVLTIIFLEGGRGRKWCLKKLVLAKAKKAQINCLENFSLTTTPPPQSID